MSTLGIATGLLSAGSGRIELLHIFSAAAYSGRMPAKEYMILPVATDGCAMSPLRLEPGRALLLLVLEVPVIVVLLAVIGVLLRPLILDECLPRTPATMCVRRNCTACVVTAQDGP